MSDADLVLAARAGEFWARETLFKRHADAVYGLAFRLLGPHRGAREVLQTAFVRSFRSLCDMKDPDAFRADLLGSVTRLVRRRLERQRWLSRLRLGREPDFEAFQSQLAAMTEGSITAELALLYQVVEFLPANQRIALLLRKLDGLAAEAIAELMDTSAPRVRRWLKSSQRQIRPLRESHAS